MTDFNEQEQQGLLLVAEAEDLKIQDQATFDRAAEMLKTIKAYLAEVRKITEPVVSAALAAHRAAVAQRTALEARALEAESILKKGLGAYEAEQRRIRVAAEMEAERIRREAMQRAQEEAARTQQPVAPVVIFTPPAPPVPKAQGVAFVDTWKYEIQDASAVPREYLIVDEKKVGAVVRALKAEAKIPGIRVYAERGVRA